MINNKKSIKRKPKTQEEYQIIEDKAVLYQKTKKL